MKPALAVPRASPSLLACSLATLAALGLACSPTKASNTGGEDDPLHPAVTVTATASASPAKVKAGDEEDLALTITASRDTALDVELAVKSPSGATVYAASWPGQQVRQGVALTLSEPIIIDPGDAEGVYPVDVTIRRSGATQPLFAQSGLAGFAVGSATRSPCSGSPVFCDDFSSLAPPQPYQLENGTWKRTTGSYTATDPTAWDRAAAFVPGDSGDFDVTLTGHSLGDSGLGLIYAAQTAESGFAVVVHPAQFQGIYLKKLVAGQQDVNLQSVPLSSPMAGQPLTLRVRRSGTRIIVSFNGADVLTADDGGSGAHGKLGLLLSNTDQLGGSGAAFTLLRIDSATPAGTGASSGSSGTSGSSGSTGSSGTSGGSTGSTGTSGGTTGSTGGKIAPLFIVSGPLFSSYADMQRESGLATWLASNDGWAGIAQGMWLPYNDDFNNFQPKQGAWFDFGLPLTVDSDRNADLREVASSAHDADFTSAVAAWKAFGVTKVIIRPEYEMDGASEDPSTFKAAWNHIVPVLRRAAAANGVTLKVAWAPIHENATEYLPDIANVDLLTPDIYLECWGPTNVSADQVISCVNSRLAYLEQLGATYHRPIGFGETAAIVQNKPEGSDDSRGAGDSYAVIDKTIGDLVRRTAGTDHYVFNINYYNLEAYGVGIDLSSQPNTRKALNDLMLETRAW